MSIRLLTSYSWQTKRPRDKIYWIPIAKFSFSFSNKSSKQAKRHLSLQIYYKLNTEKHEEEKEKKENVDNIRLSGKSTELYSLPKSHSWMTNPHSKKWSHHLSQKIHWEIRNWGTMNLKQEDNDNHAQHAL